MKCYKLKSTSIVAFISLVAIISSCGGSSSTSIEDIRDKFISAGGTCTGQKVSTPTTDPTSTEEKWTAASTQNISCGEDEPTIYLYEDASSANRAAYFLDALKAGLIISIGSTPLESHTILLDKFIIVVSSSDTSTSAKIESIANKMEANIFTSTQLSSRQEIFTKYIQTEENGGLPLAAEGCISQKLLSSDGKSVSFDTKGNDDSDGDLVGAAFCMLRSLLVPEYVFTSINETRALDGQLEESWGDYRATWRYHPDSGMQMTIIYRG
jgi:hypothetical protein